METNSKCEKVHFKLISFHKDIIELHSAITYYQHILNLDDDEDYFVEEDEAGNEWNLSDAKQDAEEQLLKLLPLTKKMVDELVECFIENCAQEMLPYHRVAALRHWVDDEIMYNYISLKSGETIRDLLGVTKEDSLEKEWVFTEFEESYDKIWRRLAQELRKKMDYETAYERNEWYWFTSYPDADDSAKNFDLKIKRYFEEWMQVRVGMENNAGS